MTVETFEAALKRAKEHMILGDHQTAIAAYREAVAADPATQEYWEMGLEAAFGELRCLIELGQSADARRVVERLTARCEGDVWAESTLSTLAATIEDDDAT